ncbi:MAG: GGDEF domain-containing protein [archaeon]|nr:GGDEF domain-containing protein [archaeon]
MPEPLKQKKTSFVAKRNSMRIVRSPLALQRGIERLNKVYKAMLEEELAKAHPDLERLKQIVEKGNEFVDSRTKQALSVVVRDKKFPAVYTDLYFKENVLTKLGENFTHTLVMMDIDDFKKKVNDVRGYGHPMGDKVLRAYTEALSEFAEKHGGFAGRHGGEEFELYLPLKPWECANLLKSRFIPLLIKKYEHYKIPFPAQRLFSAGISIEERRTIEKYTKASALTRKEKQKIYAKMIDEADDLMYKAKDNGKSQLKLHKGLSVHFERKVTGFK